MLGIVLLVWGRYFTFGYLEFSGIVYGNHATEYMVHFMVISGFFWHTYFRDRRLPRNAF